MSSGLQGPSAVDQVAIFQATAVLVAEINTAVQEEKRVHEHDSFTTFNVLSRIEHVVRLTSQHEIAEFIADTAFPTLAVRMRQWFHENSFDENSSDRVNPNLKTRIELFNDLISSFSLVSPRFTQSLMDAGYFFILLKCLSSPKIVKEFDVIGSHHGSQSRSDIRLLYRWAKTSKRREIKYETRLLEALEPYAETPDEDMEMVSVLTVGLLATEKDHCIVARSEVVRKLRRWLRKALKDNQHNFNGFSVLDIAEPLRRLSVHEECKGKIVRADVLPLLTKMMENFYSQEEQLVACETVWQLTFDKEVRKVIKQNRQLVGQLDTMGRVGDNPVNWCARGALATLHGHREHEASARLQPKYIKILSCKDDVQVKMKLGELKTFLMRSGYKVSVVDDSIESQRQKASASNASINIVLLSENLKRSPCCRRDVEMTSDSKSTTLFLTTQDYYRPDGWLRSITAGKYYFEFTEKKSLSDIDDALLSYLEKIARTSTR